MMPRQKAYQKANFQLTTIEVF
jgi:hypothetical protein